MDNAELDSNGMKGVITFETDYLPSKGHYCSSKWRLNGNSLSPTNLHCATVRGARLTGVRQNIVLLGAGLNARLNVVVKVEVKN